MRCRFGSLQSGTPASSVFPTSPEDTEFGIGSHAPAETPENPSVERGSEPHGAAFSETLEAVQPESPQQSDSTLTGETPAETPGLDKPPEDIETAKISDRAEAEVSPIRHCTSCGTELLTGAKFCLYCGIPVAEVGEGDGITHCYHCGVALPEKARFCPYCGLAIVEPPPATETTGATRTQPPPPAAILGSDSEEPKAPLKTAETARSAPSWWRRGRKRTKIGLVALGSVAFVGIAVFLLLFLRPQFVLTDLKVPDNAVSSEDILVTVDMANRGRIAGEYELSVLVDGEVVHTERVALDAHTQQQVPIKLLGRPVGRYAVAVQGWDQLSRTLAVKPKFVVTSLTVPEAVVTGEDILLTINVINQGKTKGEYKIPVVVDGDVVSRELVTLDPGTAQQVFVNLGTRPPGRYDITIAGWTEFTHRLWVMTPAAFAIEQIKVQPNPLDISAGGEVTVLVQVVNTGEAKGSHTLRLELNGQAVQTREIELEGQSHTGEMFGITVPGPGSYEVTVGDGCEELQVFQIERPENGTVLINKLAGGSNRLKVTNNYSQDCVVMYTEPENSDVALLAVYVRSCGKLLHRTKHKERHICRVLCFRRQVVRLPQGVHRES